MQARLLDGGAVDRLLRPALLRVAAAVDPPACFGTHWLMLRRLLLLLLPGMPVTRCGRPQRC